MSYTVLARRFRSRDFDELVGQEPIARTLQNAISSQRIAHAYLFTGTRGVGKTSMARIFAKAINATDELAQREAIAEAILRGDDLDVIEIDGASNRGINEAKDLIAGSGLSPARCQYKIYIIDEVHMLTREAFNALLKTMEEPPSHVKFILCTTEPHKVPATIQSRCQRFDFRPLSTTQIADQLRRILNEEQSEVDDDAVVQIARLGHGSMRDALTLLDRLLASGEKITSPLIQDMLGMPDHTLVMRLVDAITDGEPGAALNAGAELLGRGNSVDQVLEQLVQHFRQLLLIAACGESTEILDLASDAREQAVAQAGHFDPPALVHMIALCDATSRSTRHSSVARSLFDAAVVRLCMAEHFADISRLLSGAPPTGGPGEPATSEKKKPLTPSPSEVRTSPLTATTADSTAEIKPAPTVSPPDESDVLAAVRAAASPSERALFEYLHVKSFDDDCMVLSITDADVGMIRFVKDRADAIAAAIQRSMGRTIRIDFDNAALGGDLLKSRHEQIEETREMPVVAKALNLFDAEIVEVADLRPEVPNTTPTNEPGTGGPECSTS